MCGGIMWIEDEAPVPSRVQCCCGCCVITEDGPEGNAVPLTPEEEETIP
jgi:hypothetical protein